MPETRPKISVSRRLVGSLVALIFFAATLLGAYLATLVLRPPAVVLSSGSAVPGSNPLSSVATIRSRFTAGRGRYQERIGTAVVIDRDGHLVTNAHLVDGASQITVKPYGKGEAVAAVIHSDKQSDLAVISMRDLRLRPPTFYAEKLRLGQRVFAVGKPMVLSDEFIMTSGIVSALPLKLTKDSPRLLKTDAPINPGNSGGGRSWTRREG